MRMNGKTLLESLVPAINEIDSGCHECIAEFISRANKSLQKVGSEYLYEYVADLDEDTYVRVVENFS